MPRDRLIDREIAKLHADLIESYANYDAQGLHAIANQYLNTKFNGDIPRIAQEQATAVCRTLVQTVNPRQAWPKPVVAAPIEQEDTREYNRAYNQGYRDGRDDYDTGWGPRRRRRYYGYGFFDPIYVFYLAAGPGPGTRQQERNGAFILLIVVLLCLIVAAAYPSIYLLNQMGENIERLVHNEGITKASLHLTVIALGAYLGVYIGDALFAQTIIGLTITAGLGNPVVPMVLALAACGIIMAALSIYCFKPIYDKIERDCNPDALSQEDPHRYTLTESEAAALYHRGIEPVAVQCVILALKDLIKADKPNSPNYFQRSETTQEALDTLRALRRGTYDGYDNVRVGELHFNCMRPQQEPVRASAPPLPQDQYENNNQRHFHEAQQQTTPSAPPQYPRAPYENSQRNFYGFQQPPVTATPVNDNGSLGTNTFYVDVDNVEIVPDANNFPSNCR